MYFYFIIMYRESNVRYMYEIISEIFFYYIIFVIIVNYKVIYFI